LGLCLGSFATSLIWRGERGLSWISGEKGAARSQCPACHAKLFNRDLIPIFSWLFLRGKCRHCRAEIPVFYPLVECVTMVMTVLLFWAWGFSWYALPLLLAVPFFLAAIVIDWRHMILPDEINIALFLLSALHVAVLCWQGNGEWSVLYDRVFAAIALPVVFFAAAYIIAKWKKRDALGMGDLKLLPSAGLFLGIAAIPSFMMAGGVLGLLTALLKGKKEAGGPFPFGPALVISLYIHLILTGFGFHYIW